MKQSRKRLLLALAITFVPMIVTASATAYAQVASNAAFDTIYPQLESLQNSMRSRSRNRPGWPMPAKCT